MSDSIERHGERFIIHPQGGQLYAEGMHVTGGTVSVSNFPATQPVSGTVTVQDGGGSITVDGTVAATQSGAWNITNISGTVSLPTGAATAANQTNGSQLAQIVDAGGDAAVIVDPSTPAASAAWAEKGLRVLIGPTDIISNIPVIVPYDHHQLHEGEQFRWSVLNTAGINAGVNKDIRIVVPNITIGAGTNAVTLCPHLRWEFVADNFSTAFVYEAPTFSGNGNQRTPIAMERNGTYTPKLQIWEDPTVTGVGTVIWQGMITSSRTSAGGVSGSETEFILKNNTSYLIRFTSGTTGTKFLIRLVWYEDLGV